MFKRRFKKKSQYTTFSATANRTVHHRSSPKKLKRTTLLVVIGVIVSIATIYSIAGMHLFNLKQIIVTAPISCTNDQEITDYLKKGEQNLFFIDDEKLAKDISSRHPRIKSVTVQKKLPSTLEVAVSPRVPALIVDQLKQRDEPLSKTILTKKEGTNSATLSALLIPELNFDVVAASISGRFVIDADGVFFDRSTDQMLPSIIAYFDEAKIGKTINPIFVQSVSEAFDRLHELEVFVESAKVFEQRYLLLNSLHPIGQSPNGKIKLVFDLESSILKQIASLQLILQKATMEGRKIESIDLRFDKPVVVYSQQKGQSRR